MRKIIIYSLFTCLLISGCRTQGNRIDAFYFLNGKWNSSGTESYEYWNIQDHHLSGIALRMIENKLEKVDSMLIEERDGGFIMTLHIRYSRKQKAVYEFVSLKNGGYFKNNSVFPNQISYQPQKNTRNIIVKAGEDIFKNKNSFEFLYVPVD